MMDESRGEDPALSYQPMPALGDGKSASGSSPYGASPSYTAAPEHARSYSEGQPPQAVSDGAGHGQPPQAVGPSLPQIDVNMLGGPVVILGLMTWHFFWTSWANLALVTSSTNALGENWLPDSWFFFSFALIAVGLWAAADKQATSALAMIMFFAVSIFSDYIFLGIYMPHAVKYTNNLDSSITDDQVYKNIRRFSFAAVVINHLTKYLTVVIAVFAFKARGGSIQVGSRQESYNQLQ